MNNQEILCHARDYIDKMANGINPLTNEPIPDGELINNVRISRCLFYVSSVLSDLIDNPQGANKKKKVALREYTITPEERTKFEYAQEPISVTEIVRRLNEVSDHEDMKPLKYSQITDWLIEQKYLQLMENASGSKIKRPTDLGNQLGIFTETRTGAHGIYVVVLYDINAQHYIIDNLDTILSEDEESI